MKHLLLTTIAAVVLVGCGVSQEQDIWSATTVGDTNTIELLIAVGQNVNAKNKDGETPVDIAVYKGLPKTTNLLRKHGGKAAKELKAEREIANPPRWQQLKRLENCAYRDDGLFAVSKKDYWIVGIFALVIFVMAIWFSTLFWALAFSAGGGCLWFCAFRVLCKGECFGFTGEPGSGPNSAEMDDFYKKDNPFMFYCNIVVRLLFGVCLLWMATRVENLFKHHKVNHWQLNQFAPPPER